VDDRAPLTSPLKPLRPHSSLITIEYVYRHRVCDYGEPPKISPALIVSTIDDIFATVLATARVPSPVNVTIDGRDLTPVLKSASAPSTHDCIFLYYSPQSNLDHGGMGAVRCGRYKAHYFVEITAPGSNHTRTTLKPGPQDPPVLFDLETDLSESNPLDTTVTMFSAVLAVMNVALAGHLSTVASVPNQMVGPIDCHRATNAPTCAGGNDIAYAVCSAPHSQRLYPHEANCSLTPKYYGTARCRDEQSDKGCIAKCMPI
jgi:hypothetical protein